MKKMLLFIGAIGLLSGAAKAQSFTIEADTVRYTVNSGGLVTIEDTIAAATPVALKWRVFESNFPADWLSASVFGICDANLCRQNTGNQLWNGTTGTSFDCTYPSALGSNLFDMRLDLTTATTAGQYYMNVSINDPVSAHSRVMTFIVTKPHAAGVAQANAGVNGLQVFPNPATGKAYAAFDLATAGSVSCSVYDIAGRRVMNVPAVHMAAGKQQIDINTAEMATGTYNVMITTDKGTVTQHLSVAR